MRENLLEMCFEATNTSNMDNVSPEQNIMGLIMEHDDFIIETNNANIAFVKRNNALYVLSNDCYKFYQRQDGVWAYEFLDYFDLVIREGFSYAPNGVKI